MTTSTRVANPAVQPDVAGSSAFLDESANLDLLRSVAVLLVFGTHYICIRDGVFPPEWSFLWRVGQLGVLTFFVHTCLVLMWSLERTYRAGRRLIVPFYIRRAMRLYPLSMLAVLVAWVFDARWSPVNLWQNLTLTNYVFWASFPPMLGTQWTLPLEIEMYVALPVLYLVFRKRPVKLLAGTWVATAVLAWFQPHLGYHFVILRYVPCFLGGVMAWRLMRERERRFLPGWLWPVGIAAAGAMWLLVSRGKGGALLAATGMCLGLAIPLFREIRSESVRKITKIVARYSYGIYLVHFPVMVYVLSRPSPGHPHFRLIPPMPVIAHFTGPIHVGLVVGVTAVVSWALYHGLEEPAIRLGRELAQRMAGNRIREAKGPITTTRVPDRDRTA